MTLLITIAWILVLLSILVIFHEFGHFLAAKLVGVHVEEFGLGYPPRVRILFEKWKTKFSLNAIPLGGFVRLYGDDGETVEKGGSQQVLPAGVTKKKRLFREILIRAISHYFGWRGGKFPFWRSCLCGDLLHDWYSHPARRSGCDRCESRLSSCSCWSAI